MLVPAMTYSVTPAPIGARPLADSQSTPQRWFPQHRGRPTTLDGWSFATARRALGQLPWLFFSAGRTDPSGAAEMGNLCRSYPGRRSEAERLVRA